MQATKHADPESEQEISGYKLSKFRPTTYFRLVSPFIRNIFTHGKIELSDKTINFSDAEISSLQDMVGDIRYIAVNKKKMADMTDDEKEKYNKFLNFMSIINKSWPSKLKDFSWSGNPDERLPTEEVFKYITAESMKWPYKSEEPSTKGHRTATQSPDETESDEEDDETESDEEDKDDDMSPEEERRKNKAQREEEDKYKAEQQRIQERQKVAMLLFKQHLQDDGTIDKRYIKADFTVKSIEKKDTLPQHRNVLKATEALFNQFGSKKLINRDVKISYVSSDEKLKKHLAMYKRF